MDVTKLDPSPGSSEPTVMNDVEPEEADRLLRIYLQDHFAGSTAGLALVRRCRRANPALEQLLADLERDIIEDRQSLESIMSRLGVQPSRVKSAFGSVAELVGRLKNNGTVTHYSPSSRVIELEGLAAGVVTKRNLWNALSTIAHDRSELDAAQLDRLIERATAQLERILAAHRPAAAESFATTEHSRTAPDVTVDRERNARRRARRMASRRPPLPPRRLDGPSSTRARCWLGRRARPRRLHRGSPRSPPLSGAPPEPRRLAEGPFHPAIRRSPFQVGEHRAPSRELVSMRFQPGRSAVAPGLARQALGEWLAKYPCRGHRRSRGAARRVRADDEHHVHTHSAPTVVASFDEGRLRIEVHDQDRAPPRTCDRSDASGGWGLRVVAAVTDGWGWIPTRSAKHVWTEMLC